MFDEVETLVRNSTFIQAKEESEPAELKLKPIEELADLQKSLTESSTDVQAFLKPKTFPCYLFLKFLRQKGHVEGCDFLTELGTRYKTASSSSRANKALPLFERYLEVQLEAEQMSLQDLESKEGDGSERKANAPASPNDKGSPRAKQINQVASAPPPAAAAGPAAAAAGEAASDPNAPPPSPPVVEVRLRPFVDAAQPGLCDTLRAMCEAIDTTAPVDLFDDLQQLIANEWVKVGLFSQFRLDVLFNTYVQLMDYKHKQITPQDFRVFRPLGRGAFGMVSAVQKTDTKGIFAMKEMKKKQVKSNYSEDMCVLERNVLATMNQAFVLSLKYAFHDATTLFLVFDMCTGGDFKFHLSNSGRPKAFPPSRAKIYAAEILVGLEHMHSFDIIYRDLKPQNLLVQSDGHVKISDLGLCIQLENNEPYKHVAGTPGYWAPEVLAKKGSCKGSDHWSYAVTLYEMLTSRRPENKAKKKFEWSPFSDSNSNEDNALDENGILVLNIDYSDPVFKEDPTAIDLLQKLFEPDPAKRIGYNGAPEIKAHPYFKSIDWEQLERLEVRPKFIPNKHTVYAETVGDVGDFDQSKYRKMKILPEDEELYKDWNFISEEGIQKELADALFKIDTCAPKLAPVASGSSCCILL